ncbi:MAG TPA: serine/threonine-protein kinase [Thermoanaerobaculia bacterium]|nr:serine/threonine-protein kinase [Thermoanaerobaculia bacterium]
MSAVPQSFDRFEVLRVLGKGGMGTVYLARDPRLDRPVALKVLHAEDVGTDERRARFLREARTAAAIRHPNVATIYEVGESGGIPFIVMEYCEGETLSQRLRSVRLETAEFLKIAKQIAAGVAAAHEGGIVHRDLKAANIIIEPDGHVKILDFGLAKALHRDVPMTIETATGQFFGTLHYLSPEQARGQPADERSDLFSVGVVFYQMATGHLPFDSDVPLMVLEKVRDAEPEPFVPVDPTFPPSAARMIGKLLQKQPADRYQSARDLLNDLEELTTVTAKHSISHSRSLIGRTKPGVNWIRVAVLAASAAIIVIAIFFAQRSSNVPATTTAAPAPLPPIRSLAVLPLSNIGTTTRDEFLSVGLADALTTNLQQISSLQVRPTSAVLAFHSQKPVDAKTAGQKLHVDGVLQGHFLAAGDLVRVNLQLTDARTGYNVWADTIDGRRHDLLHLIDEVSARTVSALNQKLGAQPVSHASEPRSQNPRAYEEFLKARALTGSLVPAEHRAEIAALKRAIALDPNFAAAYADLAIELSLGQARALDTEPDIAQKTEWYARQAVRLDPNLAAAHLALARAFVRFPDRYRESVREDLASLRLNPNDPHALNSMTTYFVSIGELQKAQCVGDRLVRIDPNSNDAKSRGYWYVNSIDPEGAMQNAQWALQSPETEVSGHDIRAVADILMGNLPAATEETNRVLQLNPNTYLGKSLRAEIAAANGDKAAAIDALKSFEPDAEKNHWAAMRQAFCYAKIGDTANALAWVDRAQALGDHGWYTWVKHPWMQPLQTNAEFQTTIGRMKADLDDVHDDVIGVYQLICR